jgi:hypothetical protein
MSPETVPGSYRRLRERWVGRHQRDRRAKHRGTDARERGEGSDTPKAVRNIGMALAWLDARFAELSVTDTRTAIASEERGRAIFCYRAGSKS